MSCTKHGVWVEQEVCAKCLLDQIASLEAMLIKRDERILKIHQILADGVDVAYMETERLAEGVVGLLKEYRQRAKKEG